MELYVAGCHGGETPRHRTCAFVLDGRLAIDAGSLTSTLELKAQCRLEAVLVSHAHLDHVRDLATVADNRVQNGAGTLVVAGERRTLAQLRKHFFNNVLWPDFASIPNRRHPVIRYEELAVGKPSTVAGFQVLPVPVSHSIDCVGFVVSGPWGSLAYSGDTGPTDRFWKVLNATTDLRAVLVEVSFPSVEAGLAKASGHHTPETLAADLKKLRRAKEVPIFVYHIKPSFQARVERECARIKGVSLDLLALGDRFHF